METQNKKGFDFNIDCKPDYGFVTVHLPAGQKLKVEAAAMATMDTNIERKWRYSIGTLLPRRCGTRVFE